MRDKRLSGTENCRLFRHRKRNGILPVTVNVNLRKLLDAGLLRENANKKSIAAALEKLMNKQISAERI